METQTWREFKGKMMMAGLTQTQVARLVNASRTAIRRAVKNQGCQGVRRKLIDHHLIAAN